MIARRAVHHCAPVYLWDLATGSQLHVLKGHEEWVDRVALTPDGTRAVSYSIWDRTLRMWDLATGCQLYVLEGHEGWVTHVALTPDGTRTVSAGYSDKRLRVWDLATGRQIAMLQLEATVASLAISAVGSTVLAGDRLGCSAPRAATTAARFRTSR